MTVILLKLFLMLCIITLSYPSILLDRSGYTTNVQIGSSFQSLQFNFSEEILLNVANYTISSYRAGSLIYDTVFIGADTYTSAIEANQKRNPTLTLGWYANKNIESTVTSNEIYPFIKQKMLLGSGVPINRLKGFFTSIELPDGALLKNVPFILLTSPSNTTLFFPKSKIHLLDRTINAQYTFPDLGISVDTLATTNDGQYVLQLWDFPDVGIGLHLTNNQLAVTYHRRIGAILWGAYNEAIEYNFEIQICLIGLAIISLFWYLFFAGLDSTAFDTHQLQNYDMRSILMSYAGCVLATGTILRSGLVYDLLERVQYVTDTDMHLYTLMLGPCFLLVVFIHIYTTWNCQTEFELRRGTFDTILALSIACIFVGRTEIREESAVCLIVAIMWTPFQLMNILNCPGFSRLILLAHFMVFYPFVAIVLVEPIVATVPELKSVSWPASQLVIFLPPLLLLGLWTTVPSWQRAR